MPVDGGEYLFQNRLEARKCSTWWSKCLSFVSINSPIKASEIWLISTPGQSPLDPVWVCICCKTLVCISGALSKWNSFTVTGSWRHCRRHFAKIPHRCMMIPCVTTALFNFMPSEHWSRCSQVHPCFWCHRQLSKILFTSWSVCDSQATLLETSVTPSRHTHPRAKSCLLPYSQLHCFLRWFSFSVIYTCMDFWCQNVCVSICFQQLCYRLFCWQLTEKFILNLCHRRPLLHREDHRLVT